MQMKTTSPRVGYEVVRWRHEQLVDSGFAPALATTVSENAHYDLHALIELAERGCPPKLAVRILAPMEEETPA
jgi:hypothetical protein